MQFASARAWRERAGLGGVSVYSQWHGVPWRTIRFCRARTPRRRSRLLPMINPHEHKGFLPYHWREMVIPRGGDMSPGLVMGDATPTTLNATHRSLIRKEKPETPIPRSLFFTPGLLFPLCPHTGPCQSWWADHVPKLGRV